MIALIVGCTLSSAPDANAVDTNRVFAVQNRASTPNFQLFLNLQMDGSSATSGPLYGPAGGIYGLAFVGETLYATELDNGFVDWYLATIPHEGFSIGQGARVSASPVGFANVEGLAAVDGVLYGTSLDYTGHVTSLITINASTGLGSLVGTMATDIMIVGLAYDPLSEVLYGAGIPFATVGQANLYVINPVTAQATLVGPLGTPIQGLAWDVGLGLVGAFENYNSINTLTGGAAQIGTADFTDGMPGSFNGIYGLGAYVPPGLGPITLSLLAVTNGDVALSWSSVSGISYQVESRGSATTGSWTNTSGVLPASGTNSTYLHMGGGVYEQMLYRVKQLP